MANPNLLNVTTITAGNAFATATTSSSALITCPTDSLYKVVSIYCANKSAATASVTVVHDTGSVEYNIAYQVDIPPDATLQLVDKNAPLYVTEGQSIECLAGTASAIDLSLHYEAMA